MSQLGRSAQACILCHKKKVKCDLASGKQPCTNCELGNLRCRPHQRKRKHYSISPSPPPLPETRRRNFTQTPLQHQEQSDCEPHHVAWQPETPSVSRQSFTRETPARLPTPTRSDRSFHTSTTVPQLQKDNHITQTSSGDSYLGRSEYLGGSVPFNEGMTSYGTPNRNTGLREIDLQILRLEKAFDLPTPATRESLIDKYMEICSPWTPIVDRCWLEDTEGTQPSLLLLQAVFLAGSRVTSNTLAYASSEEFYRKARAIFFSGHEKNMMFTIVALCLLQWWNPTGPEQISTDTSGFWVRIAVGMAYQVGLHKEPSLSNKKDQMLRRRLWWVLVCRDNIISVGLGRPRTINLEDSDVRPPSVEDFPIHDSKARLFVTFVSICQLLGDVAQSYRRKCLSLAQRQDIKKALFRWIKDLPMEFHVFQKGPKTSLNSYNFEARQLLVPYFIIVIILHRPPIASAPSAASLVASSFVARIYEEFIARDELRHLGPAFTFYALAAGLSQLSGYRYSSLASAAEENFKVIQLSLHMLSDRWGSANGALRALTEARTAVLRLPQYREPPACVSPSSFSLLNDFDPHICNMGQLLNTTLDASEDGTRRVRDSSLTMASITVPTVLQQPDLDRPQPRQLAGIEDLEGASQSLFPVPSSTFPAYIDQDFGPQQQEYLWGTTDLIGSWLLDDFGKQDSC